MRTIALSIITLFATNAFAVFLPEWDRPIWTSNMQVTEGTQSFEKVGNIVLTLTQKDKSATPTGVDVTFLNGTKTVNHHLNVASIKLTNCSSTVYTFALPESANRTKDGLYGRFNVELTDHSTKTCLDARPFRWEAKIREGLGWCGTFDSTATLVGNPEPVFTMADFTGLSD